MADYSTLQRHTLLRAPLNTLWILRPSGLVGRTGAPHGPMWLPSTVPLILCTALSQALLVSSHKWLVPSQLKIRGDNLQISGAVSGQLSLLCYCVLWTPAALLSPSSQLPLSPGRPLDSAPISPACCWAWQISPGIVLGQSIGPISFVSHLSGSVLLPCLMSSVLKTKISDILFIFCYCCFRQESKSGPCYSCLAGNGSLGLPKTLNSRCGNLGEQHRNVSCYKLINFLFFSTYVSLIHRISTDHLLCADTPIGVGIQRWTNSPYHSQSLVSLVSIRQSSRVWSWKTSASGPVKLETRPWNLECGTSHSWGTSWSLSEVFISFC